MAAVLGPGGPSIATQFATDGLGDPFWGDHLWHDRCLILIQVVFIICCQRTVPDDFVILAARAVMQLKDNHRSNILYNMAKAIGTIREDGSDSSLPVKRMPMGLLEYIASFFAVDNLQSVSKECFIIARNNIETYTFIQY